MSLDSEVHYFLRCERRGCDRTSPKMRRVDDVRPAAQAEGWRTTYGVELCPEHAGVRPGVPGDPAI